MKLPDIGVNDTLEKNSYSLNKMKDSAKEGLSGLIVDLLGISQKDVKEGSGDYKDAKKFQKTLNELLQVSKKTEQHLKKISKLLEKSGSPVGSGSARVNVSGVPGYSNIPKESKGNASDIFKAATTRQVIDRLRIPRDAKKGAPSNWEVLDKDGNVISKPTVSRIPPALPAPITAQPQPILSVPQMPPPSQPEQGKGGLPIPPLGGKLGTGVLRRAPILIGAAAADTALGMAGVGGKQINDEQDNENWNRMSTFQKAQSGFARGIEKVGTVLGMGNMANQGRYNRIMNETNYFRNIDDAKGGPESSTFVPKTQEEAALRGGGLSEDSQIFKPNPKGLAQILDERDKRMKEASMIGPSRSVMQEQQAAANQAYDYNAAGETMSAAGFTTVTGRKVLKLGPKEMEAADFEHAQQAQAAREAIGRGLRQRRGKEGAVPIPSRPDIVEPPNSQPQDTVVTSKIDSTKYPNWTKHSKELIENVQDSGYNESWKAAFKEALGSVVPRSDSQMSIESARKTAEAIADKKAGSRYTNPSATPTSEIEPLSVTPNSQPINSLSAENRDLNRQEATTAQVQPVVIQNNNNSASQNFIPTPAQPRSGSSFSRYQERNSAY